jgi:hypothetical protein
MAMGEILGIGKLSQPVVPTIGMRVLKSGAETGVTEGRIIKVTAEEVEIAPPGMLPGYELSEGGDSGSIWVDAATNSPVALHFKGSDRGTPERAYGRPIQAVLDALGVQVVIG